MKRPRYGGSLAEVETQLELAAQLEYAETDAAIGQQAQKVGMLLGRIIWDASSGTPHLGRFIWDALSGTLQ